MITDELISDAFYLSNIVSRGFETVDSAQLFDGLGLLNKLISQLSIRARLIPYYGHTTFNMVVGTEKYNVPGLVETEAVTYKNGDVRFSLDRALTKQYFASARTNSIKTLPSVYYAERNLNGTDLYFYPLPSEAYEVQVTGKFSYTSLDADSVIDTVFDPFFIDYLTYELANRLCQFYNLTFGQDKMAELMRIRRLIGGLQYPDTTLKIKQSLSTRSGFYTDYWVASVYGGISP